MRRGHDPDRPSTFEGQALAGWEGPTSRNGMMPSPSLLDLRGSDMNCISQPRDEGRRRKEAMAMRGTSRARTWAIGRAKR